MAEADAAAARAVATAARRSPRQSPRTAVTQQVRPAGASGRLYRIPNADRLTAVSAGFPQDAETNVEAAQRERFFRHVEQLSVEVREEARKLLPCCLPRLPAAFLLPGAFPLCSATLLCCSCCCSCCSPLLSSSLPLPRSALAVPQPPIGLVGFAATRPPDSIG